VIRRIDGCGGKIYVPRAMYSLRISFWIVPRSLFISTPCSRATAMYIASRIEAGALIVIEVETLPSGISWNSMRISSNDDIETPTLPTSPCAIGSSES
jgi:hypothetical protein